MFGLFRITPHRMGFGKDSDRPAFAAGFDYRERFRLRGIEDGNRFLNIHDRMQNDVAMMQDAGNIAISLDIRHVRIGD